MDDYTSRKQIDELAELYLTGVIDEAEQTGADTDSPIAGPEPIRLSPKAGGISSTASTSAPANNPLTPINDPEDRHPVLRLTESDSHDAPAGLETLRNQSVSDDQDVMGAMDEEPAPQAMLEAVLLGNLPGMSGPWLTQYAQLIAQSEGPVALLHVGEDAIDLELIEPRAEAEPSPIASTAAVRIPPMRGNRTGLVGLLDALTRSETAPTRTVLVRLDSADDARTLSRFAAIDDWTLLCGADDASVAGAAQQLRTLVRADPRLADRNVGVMVMGSDEASARSAATRIAQSVKEELSHHVQFIGHLKRMQPVQVRELGSFPDPLAVWPQLVGWFDTLEAPVIEPVIESIVPQPAFKPAPALATQAPRAAATPTTTPQRLSTEAARLKPPTPASRPAPRPSFIATPPIAPAPPVAPRTRPAAAATAQHEAPRQTAAPAPRSQQQPTPQPQPAISPQPTTQQPAAVAGPATASAPTRPAPQPRVLARQAELDLIALLAQGPAALEDPAVLDARIPDQPETQLAVDAAGQVHILMRHDADAASRDARQAVMQLIEAGRWVREHLELLALTQRDRTFIDADPVLHLLTDRADLTTKLVGKLAGQVKLHLLQQVKLGRESGWFCTPLG